MIDPDEALYSVCNNWLILSWCCTELVCLSAPQQAHGHRHDCPSPHAFGSLCTYECDMGYALPSGGVHSVQCVTLYSEGNTPEAGWSRTPTPCAGELHSSVALVLNPRLSRF